MRADATHAMMLCEAEPRARPFSAQRKERREKKKSSIKDEAHLALLCQHVFSADGDLVKLSSGPLSPVTRLSFTSGGRMDEMMMMKVVLNTQRAVVAEALQRMPSLVEHAPRVAGSPRESGLAEHHANPARAIPSMVSSESLQGYCRQSA